MSSVWPGAIPNGGDYKAGGDGPLGPSASPTLPGNSKAAPDDALGSGPSLFANADNDGPSKIDDGMLDDSIERDPGEAFVPGVNGVGIVLSDPSIRLRHSYAMRFLLYFANASVSPVVRLCFTPDLPALVQYDVYSVPSDPTSTVVGRVRFYLAPKIDSD